MFEKFTDPAKRVLVLAQNEAMEQGHDNIGTEHVLVGLAGVRGAVAGEVLHDKGVSTQTLREEITRVFAASGAQPVGPQAATEALAAIGIDVEEIRRKADEAFGPGKFHFPRPPFSPRAKRVLEYTLRQSVELGSATIGTEHILLGILAEGEGVAVKVLRNLDVDVDSLRPAVLEKIGK
ncbi:Clp protease N-terminal domain-containing protein [Kutzneria kofuensis]|uniref:ATP-dependent Clp protease ATP-binding subunit ClpC n=1 Tax=Kutzneria kofuensis TaxID=103725 RepID=A0A7W9NEN7_9PSEU|nr:Clp protease N-terminal domain-containing protein [Kutzneria kofuensis]MBB5890512.1 ATP-dependent Clp protease ATP-binding subunit ClpC [Kutzneria kofuensis]